MLFQLWNLFWVYDNYYSNIFTRRLLYNLQSGKYAKASKENDKNGDRSSTNTYHVPTNTRNQYQSKSIKRHLFSLKIPNYQFFSRLSHEFLFLNFTAQFFSRFLYTNIPEFQNHNNLIIHFELFEYNTFQRI